MAITRVICIIVNHTVPNHEAILRRTLRYSLSRSHYENGTGVEKNIQKAVELYQKAAEQGDAMAQTNLGVYYEDGTGVEKNFQKAVELYQKAAEQGYARAKINLGACYEETIF